MLTCESTICVLTRTLKQFPLGTQRLRENQSARSSKVGLRAYQRLSIVLLTLLNVLKSQMGQNVNSPFSNIRAVTSKLHSRPRWTALVNRTLQFNAAAKSP